jgi:hypothetical protein
VSKTVSASNSLNSRKKRRSVKKNQHLLRSKALILLLRTPKMRSERDGTMTERKNCLKRWQGLRTQKIRELKRDFRRN